MNPHLRELLTDLKAAALIGHPESVQSALDGVRAVDDEQLPPSALVPLGRALTPLPAKTLKPLFVDDDPAIRALVSVALGERYMQEKDVTPQDLDILAEDPNPEVRAALARALLEFSPSRPEKIAPLVEAWLKSANRQAGKPVVSNVEPSANQQTRGEQSQTISNSSTTLRTSQQSPNLPMLHAALLLIPSSPLPPFSLLSPLDSIEDHDLRETLVTCLSTLAEKGHAAQVIDLLTEWANRPKTNVWLLTRALSASWAQSHAERATHILNDLAAQVGMIRPIVRALEKHLQ